MRILRTATVLLWFPYGSAAGQNVITEPKIKLLRAGHGQKPFDVTRHTIPLKDIEGGGVARDEIAALVHPRFLGVDEVGQQLKDSDRVLGVVLNGEAKAYPVRILNWHELVNDSIGGRPILVSW
jgi:uncharacterized protein DUF3179